MPAISIAEELAKKQREISVSEFFERNKQILGYDSATKALLTAVKEGVDNSLDAAADADILPEIFVEVRKVDKDEFLIVVEDNGPGIVKKEVANVFGRLLYGSRFFSRAQRRGQQGLGISGAVMYGQITTGKPTKIRSKVAEQDVAYEIELILDTKKNRPNVVEEDFVVWERAHGTRVEIPLKGRYIAGKQSVPEYLKATAIVNPHARITYRPPEANWGTTHQARPEKRPRESETRVLCASPDPRPRGVFGKSVPSRDRDRLRRGFAPRPAGRGAALREPGPLAVPSRRLRADPVRGERGLEAIWPGTEGRAGPSLRPGHHPRSRVLHQGPLHIRGKGSRGNRRRNHDGARPRPQRGRTPPEDAPHEKSTPSQDEREIRNRAAHPPANRGKVRENREQKDPDSGRDDHENHGCRLDRRANRLRQETEAPLGHDQHPQLHLSGKEAEPALAPPSRDGGEVHRPEACRGPGRRQDHLGAQADRQRHEGLHFVCPRWTR